MIRFALLLSIFLLGLSGDLAAQVAATPEPANSLFRDRPFGPRPPETPTPERTVAPPEEKPIPLSWIIGGASFAALAIALLLWGSARQWHSSNLFDRQYRFTANATPALRFGGKKCGGHLAQVKFGSGSRPAGTSSKPKDA